MESTKYVGAGDKPAPEIIVPLVGSKAALDEMAEDALRNPDSSACAYTWVPRTLVTDGYKVIEEGMTLQVTYKGELRPAIVFGEIRLEQTSPLQFRQVVPIRILAR